MFKKIKQQWNKKNGKGKYYSYIFVGFHLVAQNVTWHVPVLIFTIGMCF